MARGDLARALASGLPSTRQVLETFGPLAQSVAAAHRHGLVLGCAYPSRIRRADDGRLELAITPPPPGATLEQDVQGLGAVLYALLTGYWPLNASDAELGGLPRAPRDRLDTAVAPVLVRHGLAPELSALAMAALGAGVDRSHARVRTATAIGRVVGDLRVEWSSEVLPPQDHAEAGQRELWSANVGGPPPTRDPETARKLSLGVAGLAAGTVLVLCFLGYEAASMLGLGPPSPPRVVVGANIPAAAVPPANLAVLAPPAAIPPPGASGPTPNAPTGGVPGGVASVLPPPSAGPPVTTGQGQRTGSHDKKEKKKKERRSSSDD
jgi:hypothetical protein